MWCLAELLNIVRDSSAGSCRQWSAVQGVSHRGSDQSRWDLGSNCHSIQQRWWGKGRSLRRFLFRVCSRDDVSRGASAVWGQQILFPFDPFFFFFFWSQSFGLNHEADADIAPRLVGVRNKSRRSHETLSSTVHGVRSLLFADYVVIKRPPVSNLEDAQWALSIWL